MVKLEPEDLRDLQVIVLSGFGHLWCSARWLRTSPYSATLWMK